MTAAGAHELRRVAVAGRDGVRAPRRRRRLSRVRCNGFCAAGGPVRHEMWSCPSRARSTASSTLPTVTGWPARSPPRVASRSQIWVVTTDPDDRIARRIDLSRIAEGTAELIGWDGTQVAAILIGEDGVGQFLSDQPRRRYDARARPTLGRPTGRRMGGCVAGARRTARLPRPDHAARAHRNRFAAIRSRLDHRHRRHPRRSQPRRHLRSGHGGGDVRLYHPAKVYGVEQHERLRARIDPQRQRLRPRPSARGDDDRRRRVLSGGGRAAGLRPRRVRRQRRPQSTVALLWNINGAQRVTDPRIRRQHTARADSVAGHGRQRADDQRRRVDGRDDGRGPVDMPRTVELVDPRITGMGAHRP